MEMEPEWMSDPIPEAAPEPELSPEQEDYFPDLESDKAPELEEESIEEEIPTEKESAEPEVGVPIVEPIAEPIHELSVNETPVDKDIEIADMLGLLKKLKDLAEVLPEKNKSDFLASDCRLNLESIIDALESRKDGEAHEA
jgi:hypothetical protein